MYFLFPRFIIEILERLRNLLLYQKKCQKIY